MIESILQGRQRYRENEPFIRSCLIDTFIDILFLAESNDVFAAFSRDSVVSVNPYYFLLLHHRAKQ